MKFRDLPPIYARLAGFVAGSVAQRAAAAVPCLPRAVSGLGAPLDKLAPEPVKVGWSLAMDGAAGETEPPVLIVPGFFGPSFLLWPLEGFLRLHGRRVRLLRTFPAFGGVKDHAERIGRAIELLQQETGAAQVDVVTHSMGGLAGRYYLLKLDGRPNVRRFIAVATPHRGTNWAFFNLTQSIRDMKPGNPLLEELAGAEKIKGVRCINIRAGWDQIVWPREHGLWDPEQADEHELPWAEHWAVQADLRLLALVLTSLEAPDASPLEAEAAAYDEAVAREASGA